MSPRISRIPNAAGSTKTNSHWSRGNIPRLVAPFLLTGCLLLLVLAGCDSTAVQQFAGGIADDRLNGPPAGLTDNPSAEPAPAASPLGAGGEAALREIEEADLVKVVGDRIYVLHRYKGLIIVNASNPDAPTVAGRLELRGQPIEMYVVGDRAYVVLSADMYWAYARPGGGFETDIAIVPPPQPDYTGSRVASIDVSNAANPVLLSKVNLAGYAQQSRRVGNVLYVAGQNLSSLEQPDIGGNPWGMPASYYAVDRGFIASLNIADPNDLRPVAREVFRGGSVEMHVSAEAIYVASMRYDDATARGYTQVQYVDITDPAGAIDLRGAFDVPGFIRNRFFMDDFQGVFRIATEAFGFGTAEVRLFTYSLADVDQIVPLGQTQIIQNESLEAVRFDGARGYAVTFFRTDPLFVIDLSDPANPAVTGELEVPGFSTHIEPRGNRLIAVGIDDTAGRRPAVAYYDVSDPAAPTQLSRVILGPPDTFVDSEAVYEEKAFKIVDALGLIAIPFSHVEFPSGGQPIPPPWSGGSQDDDDDDDGDDDDDRPSRRPDSARPKCINAVQLIDFSDTALTQRGWFDARARVQRVGIIGSRVFAVSDASLQTINIDDRDHPAPAGEAPFLSSAEMDQFGLGCGYWGGPIWIDDGFFPTTPTIDPEALARLLSELLNNSDLCGTVSALPGALLVMGMVGARGRRWRGRKR